jgi:hypothetical protein
MTTAVIVAPENREFLWGSYQSGAYSIKFNLGGDYNNTPITNRSVAKRQGNIGSCIVFLLSWYRSQDMNKNHNRKDIIKRDNVTELCQE